MEGNEKGRIEAILFVAGDAVDIKDLARALGLEEKRIRKVLRELESEYDFQQRGFMLKRFGSKIQLATRPIYAEDVVRLLQPVQKPKIIIQCTEKTWVARPVLVSASSPSFPTITLSTRKKELEMRFCSATGTAIARSVR